MRLSAAIFLLVLAFAPAPARASDASSFFSKHAQYVGWQGTEQPPVSWTASGTRTNGRATDTFGEKRLGIAYRDTLSAAGGRVSENTGFTGSVLWKSDPNGYTATQHGPPAQIAYDANLIRSEGLAAVAGATIAGDGQAHGVPAVIVHVSPPGGLPMDVYGDPATGAILQAVIDPNGASRTVMDIQAYAQFAPGKKAVSAWTLGSMRYELSSIAAAAVASADLAPSPPSAVWQFGSGTVPLQLFDLAAHQYSPRVSLTVNGVPGIFVLDTGTPSIIVFDDFARRAGIAPIEAADFSPFSGNPRYEGYGMVNALAAGNSVLQHVLVERISQPDATLAGYVGYDFLAGTIADVNLSTSSMQLYDPAKIQPSPGAGAYAFPIDLTSRRPVIATHLSGKAIGFPYFSTGEPFFMMLSQVLRDNGSVSATDVSNVSQSARIGLVSFFGPEYSSDAMQITYSDFTGANGSGTCVMLHSTKIGPYTYQNPPLCFVGSGVFGDKGGAIGLDFLRHFDWTVDYPDAEFVLTPNSLQ